MEPIRSPHQRISLFCGLGALGRDEVISVERGSTLLRPFPCNHFIFWWSFVCAQACSMRFSFLLLEYLSQAPWKGTQSLYGFILGISTLIWEISDETKPHRASGLLATFKRNWRNRLFFCEWTMTATATATVTTLCAKEH